MLRLSPATRGGYDAVVDGLRFWVRDLELGRVLARTFGLACVVINHN